MQHDTYNTYMVDYETDSIYRFVNPLVSRQLSIWAAPSKNHIDFESDEFCQQAVVDLWLALRKQPKMRNRTMMVVVRRSMGKLLRKRLGAKGHKVMARMTKEQLDSFEDYDSYEGIVLYDIFDHISENMGHTTGLILGCFKRGANVVDVIEALQMSVSAFYIRLNRIRDALEANLEN